MNENENENENKNENKKGIPAGIKLLSMHGLIDCIQ